jgi:hypothetical protein
VEPLEPVAEWLSRKLKRRIGTDALLRGGEIHGKDGWHVRSLAVLDQYPHLASIELIHPDVAVSGRRWHSEIGLYQRLAGADVDLTVLVQTSEISARVTAPVSPGAPTFVSEILRRCQLSSAAIGGDTRVLDDGDAEAFRYVALDGARDHPLVVVSPTRDGKYLVDSPLLSQLLIGVAELVVIPPSADTFWLARSVGADFVPYLGAAKIIYSSGNTGRPTVRTFTPHDVALAALDPRAASRELFSLVLHRTNLPLSWKHVGRARVKDELLKREFERRRAAAAATGDAAEYTRFMEEYVKEQELAVQEALLGKKRFEEALDAAQRIADDTQRDQRSKIEALKLQLESAGSTSDESPYAPEDIAAVAETVASAIKNEPTPEECLRLLEHLFPTRVAILPEAWTSSRESAGFRYGQKLYGLLHALATTYWLALCEGTPDQEARKVFGSAYAAKESDGVASNKGAKRRRTFRFGGVDHVMVKHLKIGVKDNAGESIRVHFEWFAEHKRIVIGHCGPHIPFS